MFRGRIDKWSLNGNVIEFREDRGGSLYELARSTQPPTLCRTGNEYRPKCGDALRLVTQRRAKIGQAKYTTCRIGPIPILFVFLLYKYKLRMPNFIEETIDWLINGLPADHN